MKFGQRLCCLDIPFGGKVREVCCCAFKQLPPHRATCRAHRLQKKPPSNPISHSLASIFRLSSILFADLMDCIAFGTNIAISRRCNCIAHLLGNTSVLPKVDCVAECRGSNSTPPRSRWFNWTIVAIWLLRRCADCRGTPSACLRCPPHCNRPGYFSNKLRSSKPQRKF